MNRQRHLRGRVGTALLATLAVAAASAVMEAPAVEGAPGVALSLQLVPLSGAPIALGKGDFERLPHKTVWATYSGGAGGKPTQAELSGVPLRELMNLLGLPTDHALRGEALQLYLEMEISARN
jgi:hypothetical protein